MHDRVIRPFLSDPTVIRASYLNILELYVLSHFPPGTLLQQDGPPPYYSHIERNCLSFDVWRMFGREGPFAWLPRSPNLKLLDFFL
jgi:hypothetical protein